MVLSVCALYWDDAKQSRLEYAIANGGIALGNVFLIIYETGRHRKVFAAGWLAVWTLCMFLNYHSIGTTFPLTLAAIAFSSRAVVLYLMRAAY